MVSLCALAVIILSVILGVKLLCEIVGVGSPVYIDEETEGYVNGPNRLD